MSTSGICTPGIHPASIPDEAIEAMEMQEIGQGSLHWFQLPQTNNMVPFILKTGVFDVMQTTYSFPIGGRFRNDAVDKLHEAGIGVIAMKVVVALSGFNLANIFPPAQARRRPARRHQMGPDRIRQ